MAKATGCPKRSSGELRLCNGTTASEACAGWLVISERFFEMGQMIVGVDFKKVGELILRNEETLFDGCYNEKTIRFSLSIRREK